jgi:hypothetical protein
LKKLRTLGGGGVPIANSNYGNATAYQAPLALRFGGKLSF